jgi:hypothetical protein
MLEVAGKRLRTDDGDSKFTLSKCFCNESCLWSWSLSYASVFRDIWLVITVLGACMMSSVANTYATVTDVLDACTYDGLTLRSLLLGCYMLSSGMYHLLSLFYVVIWSGIYEVCLSSSSLMVDLSFSLVAVVMATVTVWVTVVVWYALMMILLRWQYSSSVFHVLLVVRSGLCSSDSWLSLTTVLMIVVWHFISMMMLDAR